MGSDQMARRRLRARPDGHPDAAMLTRARQALDWWGTQAPARPTSSITGGGAVHAAEQALSDLLGGCAVLALPNATFGLSLALTLTGVGPGDDVLVSALDWPAARWAVRHHGARPVPIPVDPRTLTVGPEEVARARTAATRAAVVTHLHGLCADVPGIKRVLGDAIPVVEDAAQALGSSLNGEPAGTLGDIAVFSAGPGKAASGGELGFLVTGRADLYRRAVRLSQHPARQLLAGIEHPEEENNAGRPAPLATLLGAYELTRWPATADRLRRAERRLRPALSQAGIHLLGTFDGQPGRIPILLRDTQQATQLHDLLHNHSSDGPFTPRWARSGATVCPGLGAARHAEHQRLARRAAVIDLSPAAPPGQTATPARWEPAGRAVGASVSRW